MLTIIFYFDICIKFTLSAVISTIGVPKRPFVFSQQSTKFYSCTQTAIRFFTVKYEILQFTQMIIRFFTTKYEILQLYPNGHSFFNSEIRNLELYQAAIRSFTTKYEIFKVVPKL